MNFALFSRSFPPHFAIGGGIKWRSWPAARGEGVSREAGPVL